MSRRRSKIHPLALGVAVFAGVFAVSLAVFGGAGQEPSATPVRPKVDHARALARDLFSPPPDQHFSGCDAARAAGRTNIPSSDPLYRRAMDGDGDGDGLACEPWR